MKKEVYIIFRYNQKKEAPDAYLFKSEEEVKNFINMNKKYCYKIKTYKINTDGETEAIEKSEKVKDFFLKKIK